MIILELIYCGEKFTAMIVAERKMSNLKNDQKNLSPLQQKQSQPPARIMLVVLLPTRRSRAVPAELEMETGFGPGAENR